MKQAAMILRKPKSKDSRANSISVQARLHIAVSLTKCAG